MKEWMTQKKKLQTESLKEQKKKESEDLDSNDINESQMNESIESSVYTSANMKTNTTQESSSWNGSISEKIEIARCMTSSHTMRIENM